MTKREGLDLNAASLPSFKKTQKKPNGGKIRRMLAVMERQASQSTAQTDGTNGASDATAANEKDNEQFFSTGRTGRRNALPDILGEHAHVTSSDLPARLEALTTTESSKLSRPEDEPGPSRQTSGQK